MVVVAWTVANHRVTTDDASSGGCQHVGHVGTWLACPVVLRLSSDLVAVSQGKSVPCYRLGLRAGAESVTGEGHPNQNDVVGCPSRTTG